MPRCNVLFQRRTSKLINSFFLNMKTSFFIMWGPYLLNYNPGRIKKNQYPIATLIPQVFAVSLTNNISPNLLYLIKLWVIGQSLHLNQSMYNAPKFNDLDWTNIPYGFTALSYLILKTDGVTHGKICPQDKGWWEKHQMFMLEDTEKMALGKQLVHSSLNQSVTNIPFIKTRLEKVKRNNHNWLFLPFYNHF